MLLHAGAQEEPSTCLEQRRAARPHHPLMLDAPPLNVLPIVLMLRSSSLLLKFVIRNNDIPLQLNPLLPTHPSCNCPISLISF
eukprot:c17266_g1_i1 orf=15-263(-)